MIYISHLDLMRLLGRSARRAELPVAYSQGFSPRAKIGLRRALKLGVASDEEAGEIILSAKLPTAEMRERWQKQLPSGIEIYEITHFNRISQEWRNM